MNLISSGIFCRIERRIGAIKEPLQIFSLANLCCTYAYGNVKAVNE